MHGEAQQIFSRLASTYDEVRPGYPDELYEVIRGECSIEENSLILEIGAGTGIATEEMYTRFQSPMTALEPGLESFDRLRSRMLGYEGVSVLNTSFERFVPVRPFDCIVSATAFHWVDRKTRFALADRSLKEEGSLILFWNNYSRTDDSFFDEIQAVYKHYYPVKTFNNDIRIIQRKSIEDRKREITKSGLFEIVRHEEFLVYRTYSADDYVRLLKTFSKNAKRPAESMSIFYEKMNELVASRGGLKLPILVDLNIARKAKPRI